MHDKDRKPEEKRERPAPRQTTPERELELAKRIIERWMVE
jgi:hypothetical protein